MDPELERARTELRQASEVASGVVETQLHSIDQGIFEEEDGELTQEQPGPKVDRIAEVSEKLEELQAEAEVSETSERIATAREHLQTYLKTHPEDG